MEIMTKGPSLDSIYNFDYPCYIAGIPAKSDRIIHIPGKFEYKDFDNTFGYVIEGYKVDDLIYLFDCMQLQLWYKKKCNIFYQKRLSIVRSLVNDEIGLRPFITDLPMVLVDNPGDAKEYMENLLQSGFTSVRVMSPTGYYVFGEVKNKEYLEIDIEQAIR